MSTISMTPGVHADVNAPLTLDFAAPFGPQVQAALAALPDLRKIEEVALSGQGVAAVLSLAGLELAIGLPVVTLTGFGPDSPVVGSLDLRGFRHNTVRSRREESPTGEAFAGHTVLDGAGRGVTPAQLTELAATLGVEPDAIRVFDVSMGHVDPAEPQKGVADRLLQTGLTKADWTSGRIVFLPPGLGTLTAVMATAIYGLSEVWPPIIRLASGIDRQFHVAEVCDPQALRQSGAALVAKWAAGTAPVAVPRDLFDEALAALPEGDLRERFAALAAK